MTEKDIDKNGLPKLSNKEMLILGMLIGKGEMFGLEMIEASEGELKRGTIYVTLQRMSDKGYVGWREDSNQNPEVGIPRRKYLVTGLGEKVFEANVKANEIFRELIWGI